MCRSREEPAKVIVAGNRVRVKVTTYIFTLVQVEVAIFQLMKSEYSRPGF